MDAIKCELGRGLMRNLLQAVLDELDKDEIQIAILGEFEFLSGTQNLWIGPEGHVLDYDSKQWVALGEIGQIDKLAEGQGLADSRTTVSLRIDSESVDVVDVEDSRGRDATITLLLLSNEGDVIGPIDFRTTMGPVNIASSVSVDEHGGKLVSERLSLELLSETATLEQSFFVRNTYEAGRRIDVTDHGLEFVSDPEMHNIGLDTKDQPRGCFAYGTQFKMADGALKEIQNIEVCDDMLEGGKVFMVIQGDGLSETWYSYNGIEVTGAHAVLEDGKWVRLEDAKQSIQIPKRKTFYTVHNINHRMVAHDDQMFLDNEEVSWHDTNESEYVIDLLNKMTDAEFHGKPT